MKALLLLLVLAHPAAFAQEPACPFPGQSTQLVAQVFFGQSRDRESRNRASGNDGLVSRRAWERFVADTITPALPGGFTLTSASGHWQDPVAHASRREPTEVLIAAAPDSPAFRNAIAGISDEYRRRFDQHTVGIISSLGCAAF